MLLAKININLSREEMLNICLSLENKFEFNLNQKHNDDKELYEFYLIIRKCIGY